MRGAKICTTRRPQGSQSISDNGKRKGVGREVRCAPSGAFGFRFDPALALMLQLVNPGGGLKLC